MLLKEQNCRRITSDDLPLGNQDLDAYMEQLSGEWKILDNKELQKRFPFENFKRGMAFAQNVGLLAEKQQHHPHICIEYSYVLVTYTTHDIGGLSVNDFIMAAKTDEL